MIGYLTGNTICDIDELYLNMRDDPTKPRSSHEGVFTGAKGEFPALAYLGEELSIMELERKILEYYEFREIGFATFQEFQKTLVRVWNENFGVLAENLNYAQQLTLTDEKEEVVEHISGKISGGGSGLSTQKFTNTPNQYIAASENFNGLTNMTQNAAQNDFSNQDEHNRTLTTQKSHNIFEKWLELSERNRNIIYDFIKKFEWLFAHTFKINNYV